MRTLALLLLAIGYVGTSTHSKSPLRSALKGISRLAGSRGHAQQPAFNSYNEQSAYGAPASQSQFQIPAGQQQYGMPTGQPRFGGTNEQAYFGAPTGRPPSGAPYGGSVSESPYGYSPAGHFGRQSMMHHGSLKCYSCGTLGYPCPDPFSSADLSVDTRMSHSGWCEVSHFRPRLVVLEHDADRCRSFVSL